MTSQSSRDTSQNPKIQGEINARVDEPIQLPHRDGKKEDRNVKAVRRFQTDQRDVCKGCLPDVRINYILDQLTGSRYISSLDLKDGHWQIPLKESSRQYTAFTVPGKGLLQCRLMPFGLNSTSATFQRVSDEVIGPEMSPHAFAYQDDILVIVR